MTPPSDPGARRRVLGALSLPLLAVALMGCAGSSALETATGGSGELCSPTDDRGVTTIGHEQVVNGSSKAVTVTDIELPASGLTLLDWTTMPLDWPGGGARKGDHLPGAGGSPIIEPGDAALVVLLVRAETAERPRPVTPTLYFTDGDGAQGSVVLTWEITAAPPGTVCD